MHDEDDDDLFLTPLNTKALSRNTDLPTSRAAAESLDERDVTRMEGAAYTAIKRRGDLGATWDEVGELTGIDKASLSPRWKPLRRKKKIEWRCNEQGEVIKRVGKSNRGQTVWFAKEK